MTRQEMFDKAYLGVIKQGGPAVQPNHNTGGSMCSYLTPDGRMCAVGHLMTDEELKVMGIFKGGVFDLRDEWGEDAPAWMQEQDDRDFLAAMQDAHDNLMGYEGREFVTNYMHDMEKVAAFYNLTVPELEQE